MANITDPQAATFVRLQLRPRCDQLASMIIEANRLVTVWDSLGMDAIIPASDDKVVDESGIDKGRQVSGNEVNTVITMFRAIVANAEANSRAQIKAVVKCASNP